MTARWERAALAGIARQRDAALPLLADAGPPIAPGLDLWDMWPLAHPDGATVTEAGRSLWFFLAAPRLPDPEQRHYQARIHTLTAGPEGWRHHGPTLPDDWSPGTREWSGSAVLADGRVQLHFTATGRRGEPHSYEQRLFASHATLAWRHGAPAFGAWSTPVETVAADGRTYARADQASLAGGLRAFRDPGYFRDPADGAEYIAFTGSRGGAATPFDGLIGLARRDGAGWALLPPLVDASGVVAELERPHLLVRDGRYYLFWSTPAHRFAPGVNAPTGLYAMAAPALAGPWTPVNGTGLVAANPAEAGAQAYCWWVTGELDVLSFIDLPGALPVAPADRRARFGGVPAPFFRLVIDGDRITPASPR